MSSLTRENGLSPDQQNDQAISCGLCHGAYGARGIRVPRILQGCGHTVCEGCVTALVEHSIGEQLLCPFDRVPSRIRVDVHGRPGLPKNFALLEVVDRLCLRDDGSMALENQLDYVKERLMGICCDEEDSHLALVHCLICSSNLCLECWRMTHSGRVLSQHKRVPLSEKPMSRAMCPFHSAYALEFVCQQVDCGNESSRLMCLLCRDYGRHRGHPHSLLEVEAIQLRMKLKDGLIEFRTFISSLVEGSFRLARAIADLSDTVDGSEAQAERQVIAHFRRQMDQLEHQQLTAVSALRSHVRERTSLLSQHREEMANITSQVSAVCAQIERSAMLDEAQLIGEAEEMLRLINTVRQQANDFRRLPDNEALLDSRISFSFTNDNVIHMGANIDLRVVVLGLDGAGKTTIVFKLKNNELRNTVPTIGFNVETVQYKRFKLTMWDVGGIDKLRPLWKHYYKNTQALIFVIDADDSERFAEAQGELARVLGEADLRNSALLVLLNRRGLSSCVDNSTDPSTELLLSSLTKLCTGRSLLIRHCDPMSAIGLWEALEALTSQLVLSED